MKKLAYVVIVLLIIVVGWLTFSGITNSRTFQAFGRIVSRSDTSQKIVCLTLDDGPTSSGTTAILRILDEHKVPVTFFVTGAELEQNPDLGKQIVEAGHELGNHSYSHQRMVLVTPSFVQQEIERTDELIRGTGYDGQIHFRPPYGKKLIALPYYLSQSGRTTVMWDVEPDSNARHNSDAIVERALAETRPGSIILLHVMYPARAESLKAVPRIIESLKAEGYRFVTVSELLAAGD